MNRLLRVASATFLLVGAVSASHLSLPGATVACSCIAPEPGAPVFTGDEGAVLLGTVRPDDGRGTTIDPGADTPPDLGLVAIALVTFVVGLTAAAALLAFSRRREPPPPDTPTPPDTPDQP